MRKPARLERAGALTPRDRIWGAVRSFGRLERFSVIEVGFLSGQRTDTVLTYLRALEKARYLGGFDPRPMHGDHRRELQWFQLIKDCGVEAPRVTNGGEPVTQGAGRMHMWRAIKILREFDCRELAAGASTEQHEVSLEEVKTYTRFLAAAGYLQVTDRGGPGAPRRYRFVSARNTGPRAPLVTRRKGVIDGNTGQTMLEDKL